jgi:hypothetical protein
MDKKFAARNIRMGLLLTGVVVLMGLMSWLWTVLYLAFANSNV